MLKRMIRKLLGDDRWSYLEWSRARFGLLPAIMSAAPALVTGRTARVPAAGQTPSVRLRPGIVDPRVYDEIFVERELDIELGQPSFIVDAGAHIGLASAYLANRYPDATIVALEPDSANFTMLQLNTCRYPNVVPIRAGLWSRTSTLRIANPEAPSWAFRVEEDPFATGIPAIGIQDLMAAHGATRIDFLKIDIEGSEQEVFADDAADQWLERVETLLIELHETWIPGSSGPLMRRLKHFDCEQSDRGEKKLLRHLRRRSGPVPAPQTR